MQQKIKNKSKPPVLETTIANLSTGLVTASLLFTDNMAGEPEDGFLLNTLKTLFRLSRVFLDI